MFQGKSSGSLGGDTPDGHQEGEVSAACVTVVPPNTVGPLQDAWSVWGSISLALDLRWGLALGGPCFPTLASSPPFCPQHPPGLCSHIKPSLCQAGGREPQRAAGGGEEEVAHTAREHLEPI